MNTGKVLRSALVVVTSFVVCASANAAGLFRAYLASDGSDSNPCTVAAPCRLLPAALAAVADGGEIWMLDSANYNTATVNITKSVTILAVPGAVGSVVSISGNAIYALTPGTSVALRNLLIVPFPGGGGASGIRVEGAAKLTVENSVISGHPQSGILVFSQTAVRITNCTIRDNGIHGVSLQGGATAEISGSRFLNNGAAGVAVFGTVASTTSAAISDSVLSANVIGLDVDSVYASTDARASITRSTLSDNSGEGVLVYAISGATALATVGSNMITGNGTGLYRSNPANPGVTLESLGDNMVRQNTAPSFGSITTASPL
jgi:parallel beta-helix repeat protein